MVLVEHEPTVKLNSELDGFAWISLRKLIEHRGKVKFSFGEIPPTLLETLLFGDLPTEFLRRL